jgi:hypothetical protein
MIRKNANLSYLSDLPMELRGKEAALCAYAKGDTCSLSIVASELNCKKKLQIQLLLEYLSIHDPLALDLLLVTLGWMPLIRTKTLIHGSHIYESHPIIFESSFSSELFENYVDKTIQYNQVPSCLCL